MNAALINAFEGTCPKHVAFARFESATVNILMDGDGKEYEVDYSAGKVDWRTSEQKLPVVALAQK